MSDNTTDMTDGAPTPVSSDDTRKPWVTPTIEELPINQSQGTLNLGAGGDVGVYT